MVEILALKDQYDKKSIRKFTSLCLIIAIAITPNVFTYFYFNIHDPEIYKPNDCKDVSQFVGDTLNDKIYSCHQHNNTIKLAQELAYAYFVTSLFFSGLLLFTFLVFGNKLLNYAFGESHERR